MSAHPKKRDAVETAVRIKGYDRIMKTVHWTTLLLVIAVYLASWASQLAATKEQQAVLLTLHRSLGVTILALTLFRLGWRWRTRIPGLPEDLPAMQKLAARATEYLLYMLLLLQPVLGVLNINARGRRIDFYFLGELPPIIGPDKALAKQAMAAHDIVGYLLLAVIALHAVGALFHHLVRRDDVLNTMLPGRGR
jgi:cytochrome b561